MKWNVYYYNINRNKIEIYNIFNHGGFYNDVIKFSKKCTVKEEFEKELKNSLQYFFWSKSEWEILISPWIGKDDCKIKIDVYDQVINNWEVFVDYVWNYLYER